MSVGSPVNHVRTELARGGYVEHDAGFIERGEADVLLRRLLAETPWQQGEIVLFGKKHLEPRLSAWYGDRDYVYSGRLVPRAPWTPTLLALKRRVETRCGAEFNSVLINRYRDGRDGMGMHSDDERELGRDPLIGSLSLGQARRFVLEPKHRSGTPGQRLLFELGHGDLLLMGGSCQHHYRHGVPKQPAVRAERLNLTFRYVHTEG